MLIFQELYQKVITHSNRSVAHINFLANSGVSGLLHHSSATAQIRLVDAPYLRGS